MSFFQNIFSRFGKVSFPQQSSPTRTKVVAQSMRPVSGLELLKHLGIMATLLLLLVIGFFFIYLPASTNHNDTVEVPKIIGMKLTDIEDILDKQELRYEVQDSDYVSTQPPLTIITQYPSAGDRVKEDRKIMVTVVARNPPTVEMPDLKDLSLRSAQETLESFGLHPGNIIYKPDSLHPNAVRAQQVNGKNIKPGTRIARHTRVDLVMSIIGNNKPFAVPNLIGRTLADAESILAGLDLLRGSLTPDTLGTSAIVSKQVPTFGRNSTIRKGERVDLWLSAPRARPAKVVTAPADTVPAPTDTTR